MKAWIAMGVLLASTAWADRFDPFASMHGRPPAQHDGLPAEDLARLAAPPLDPAVAHRLATMFAVHGASGGAITDRGDRQFFTWQDQVWRQDGPGRFPIQLTSGEAATVVGVSPDARWLAVSRGTALYVVDAAGGPLRLVEPSGELAYITDDSKALYVSASGAIARWENGHKTVMFDAPGTWHVVDHRGDVWLMVNDLGQVHEYDVAKKALAPVPGAVEGDVAYGAKPGQLLVRTSKPSDFARLYALEGGKLTPITPAMDHDVTAFRIDEARARIYYTVNVGGYERLHALDARTLARIDLPALPESENQRLAGLSRNGRFAQIELDAARFAPTVVTLDWTTKKLATWRTPSTAEVDVATFAPVTLETYPARDGTKVPMFVRRPATCAQPCPAIVMMGGGAAGFDAYAQAYVDAGFVVVAPNVRGLEGYGRAWLEADGSGDIEDLCAYLRTAWAKDGRAPKLGVAGGAAVMNVVNAFDAGVANEPLPIAHVAKVEPPLLVLQEASGPREAQEIVERGVPGELMLFLDEARDNAVLRLGHTLAFFEKHLTAK